jgi:hypothetical protein
MIVVAATVLMTVLMTVPAAAQAPPPTTVPPPVDEIESGVTGVAGEPTPVTLPLIPVPVGCDAPATPHVVFVGRVVDRDYRTIRFDIERVRGGRPEPFAAGNVLDVRYGLDAQYLEDGERYLVSAPVHPDLGFLVSRIAPPVEDFGGDEVIGVSESDVNCPVIEDPTLTLHVDGTLIEGGVLRPLRGARPRIVGAVLVPLAVGFGVIFVLALLRLAIGGLTTGVAGLSRRRA